MMRMLKPRFASLPAGYSMRIIERDGVHAVACGQGGKARFLLVLARADLCERPIGPQLHGHRFAALGISAQLAGAGGLAALDGLELVLDLMLEGLPEILE